MIVFVPTENSQSPIHPHGSPQRYTTVYLLMPKFDLIGTDVYLLFVDVIRLLIECLMSIINNNSVKRTIVVDGSQLKVSISSTELKSLRVSASSVYEALTLITRTIAAFPPSTSSST
jgi:hypothetical protein